MHHTGIDIIEISRIERAVARWGQRFLRRIYSDLEIKQYRHKIPSLAARFAGKEAVVKAMGTRGGGICWREIEILSDASGKPVVNLYGQAQAQFQRQGCHRLSISLSHSRDYAIASVVVTMR